MNQKAARSFRWILTAVIVVFLIMFARTIDWAAAWNSIRNASLPLLLAALVVNFASIAIKGVRWWLFLKPAGAPSLPLAMRATLAGAGLNNVLVANGGDAARVVFVSRATGVGSSTILATLALERMFDVIGFVVLLVFGVIAFDLPPIIEKWRIPAMILLAAVMVFLVWFVYRARNGSAVAPAQAQVKPRTVWERFRRYLSEFATSTRSLTTGWRFFWAFVLSMLSWAGQVATFALAAAAAHVSLPLAGSFAGLLAINIGLVIRATPGNVGFFQFVYALAAEEFGVGRADAIAVSLLIQTLQIIPLTIVGVALAPEFIFKGRAKKDMESMPANREPGLLGDSPKESEKLGRAPG